MLRYISFFSSSGALLFDLLVGEISETSGAECRGGIASVSIIDSKRRLLYLLSISERVGVVREVRTGHVALRCKYLTYGNRYVDRVHSAGLLATLDPLGLPSGIE